MAISIQEPRILVLPSISEVFSFIERIKPSIELLQKTNGFYRPSFSRFYYFFYWKPYEPVGETVVDFEDTSLQYVTPLSSLHCVVLEKLSRILDWRKDTFQPWIRLPLHPLIQVRINQIQSVFSYGIAKVNCDVMQLLFLDEIYPSLQVKGISFLMHESENKLLSGTVDLVYGSLDYMRIQIMIDHFPLFAQLSCKSHTQSAVQFMPLFKLTKLRVTNPVTPPFRIRMNSFSVQSVSSLQIIQANHVGVSLQQGGDILFSLCIDYTRLNISEAGILLDPALVVECNLTPALFDVIRPLPYFPPSQISFHFSIGFTQLAVSLLANQMTLRITASHGHALSNSTYSVDEVLFDVIYANNPQRTLMEIQQIDGKSTNIKISSIRAGITAGILQDFVKLKTEFPYLFFRFFTQPRIVRLLYPVETPVIPFSIKVNRILLLYVSLHPDPKIVHQIALAGVVSSLVVSSSMIFWDSFKLALHESETPLSVNYNFDCISDFIVSVPSPQVEFSPILSIHVPKIMSVLKTSDMTIIVGILDELMPIWHGRYIVMPKKVDIAQFRETWRQWLEIKWNSNETEIGSILDILNAMTKSLQSQQMKRPEEIRINVALIQVQCKEEEKLISMIEVKQLEWEFHINGPSIHSVLLIESAYLNVNHPKLDRPMELKQFHPENETPQSVIPLLQLTFQVECNQLFQIHSAIMTISPLQLQFSIPALKTIISFFENTSISKHPKPSPFSQSVNLRYLRMNAIQVFCSLLPTVSGDNYSLIPFRLHPIVLHDRVCSMKQLFSSLRMYLFADLLSQASQHVSQASAVMANAMGFSGLVSLLRKPIRIPTKVSEKHRRKQRVKKIRQLLGKKVKDVSIVPIQMNDIICTEQQQPNFINDRFESIQKGLFLICYQTCHNEISVIVSLIIVDTEYSIELPFPSNEWICGIAIEFCDLSFRSVSSS